MRRSAESVLVAIPQRRTESTVECAAHSRARRVGGSLEEGGSEAGVAVHRW